MNKNEFEILLNEFESVITTIGRHTFNCARKRNDILAVFIEMKKELDNTIPVCGWCKNKKNVVQSKKQELHQWVCTKCNHFI